MQVFNQVEKASFRRSSMGYALAEDAPPASRSKPADQRPPFRKLRRCARFVMRFAAETESCPFNRGATFAAALDLCAGGLAKS